MSSNVNAALNPEQLAADLLVELPAVRKLTDTLNAGGDFRAAGLWGSSQALLVTQAARALASANGTPRAL